MSLARSEGRESVPLARQLAQTFGRAPSEVRRARHLMTAWLEAWESAPEDRSALELVVAELVTNAICHGLGSVELYVYASDTVVRVEVCDQGGGRPRVRPVERSGPRLGGWGLRLVDQLTDTWGTWVRPGRTVVWAQRSLAGGSSRSLPLVSALRLSR